jgi:DNA-binding MarR family transcriptional regulator
VSTTRGDRRLDRTGNLLGALSLAVTERTSAAAGDALGQSESGAVALSALHHFLDDPSVDLLRQVLGLTASGTVRLVDRLQDAGYITRRPGRDGRSVSLRLTAAGRRAAQRVSAARADVLKEALAGLDLGDRQELDRIMSTVLVGSCAGRSDPLDVPALRHDRMRPHRRQVPGGQRRPRARPPTMITRLWRGLDDGGERRRIPTIPAGRTPPVGRSLASAARTSCAAWSTTRSPS